MVRQLSVDDTAAPRFVLLPESEYRRLQGGSGESRENGPELSPPDSQGSYPAAATLRAMVARDIVQHRRALGLSQAELARRASIRVETLNRLEQGKHTPSIRTVERLDQALRAAEAQAAEVRGEAGGPVAPAKRKPRAQPRRPRKGK
jgi:ribosome-binding protein aMBF1 (putative translation factor)